MNMKKKNLKRILSVMVVMVFMLIAPSVEAAAKWTGVATGDILIKDTVTAIATGVTGHEVITNTEELNDQKIDYFCEVESLDTLEIVAGYGKDNADSWSLTATTEQAAAYEKNHPGETVVAAINGDFFNMATGEPLGALVMEGKVKHASNGRNYFGITKDGTPVIRNTSDLSDLEMAVGGDAVLVENGEVIPELDIDYGALNYSRTAIGIKADGTVVLHSTYGLRAPISCGRTYSEMAEMFKNAGCVSALALDGGGSATYAARPEGTEELKVANSPADGAERAVSSSILVVSTAEETDVFSHASLTPNNEVYTPGSEVQFEAVGVDTAGFAMDLPKNVTWALAEDSKDLGSIEASTGKFTANDKTGVVTVNLMEGDKVVGTTTIEVAKPDQIYFASEEVSLGFEEESDLGIVVRSEGRDMHYNAGDIIWEISDEKLGTFTGNTFLSSAADSATGTATATSRWDEEVTGSITVIVGKLPTIVWDFEDKTLEDGTVIDAQDYYVEGYTTSAKDETTGEDVETSVPGILTHSNYDRGGNESIEIVGIDDEEPVRFGAKSLKLNYDFINCGEVTEGACVGTTEKMEVPGVPTGIGVWVYAPEGVGIDWPNDDEQSGLWLRGYVMDGNGSNQPFNYTFEPKTLPGGEKPGIYWEGWKYLEADLTSLAPPYGIQAGMTFRLMFVAGTKMGTRTANSIYFDNLQFVYGTNVDDVDAPVIDSMTLDDKEIEDGMTIDTNKIGKISTLFHDVQNKYTTGIDHSTVRMYLDGVNLANNENFEYAYDQTGLQTHLYNVELLDGKHSITLSIRDGFGNETKETRYFTVDTKSEETGTTVQVVPAEEKAIIGKTVRLQIKASDATVKESLTSFKLGNQFKDYEVEYSDNYEGKAAYSKLEKTITITADRKEEASAEDGNIIATLIVDIPSTLKETDNFNYTVTAGGYLTESGVYRTYSYDESKMEVGAPYSISAAPVIVGGDPAVINVVDTEDKPVQGVGVYKVSDDSLVGTTDENGQITTNIFNSTAGSNSVYAKDSEGGLSFQYTIKSYSSKEDAKGLPSTIRFNTVENPATQKNISWMTSVLNKGKQVIQYKVSGQEEWTTVEAKTKQVEFDNKENDAANVNGILLKDLAPETTYEYQVGTEDAMSEVATFTTNKAGKTTNEFFIIGDIQDTDKAELDAVINKLQDKDYDFGIQIGDAVDQANDYTDWKELGARLGAAKLGDTNMINIMGNHEYYGDSDASTAAAMYNSDQTGEGAYYSLEYGNIYIAVINFSNTGEPVKEAAEWLVEDAAKSDATWKLLCMHQPAYYTNEGGNKPVYKYIPDAAEAAGIDIVFSGHDHSAAVTNLLLDDEVNEEEGIAYYLVGAAGSKRYTPSTQDIFDYDKIFKMTPTADYTSTYLTVSSDKEKITVNFYDVNTGLLNTLELETKCKRRGHEPLLDPEANEVTCKVCKEALELETITGEVFDAEGNEYYLMAGVIKTGWGPVGEEIRYYNEKGIREEITAKETPSTCIIDGYCVYTNKAGEEYIDEYNDAGGHEYEEKEGQFVCKECGHIRVEMEDCDVSLSYTECTYNGKARTPSTTAVAPDGTVLTKTGAYRDYYSKYENNTEVGTASVTLTAAKYGVYVNMNEWRGNCKGSVTVTYEIRPQGAKNAYVVTEGTNATIKWDKAENIDKYVVYQYVDKKWKEIGTTTETSYTVKGLEKDSTCKFRVGTRKTGSDGKEYESLDYAEAKALTSTVTAKYSAATGKPVLSWTYINGATFTVYRSTSANGKYTKVFTTAGKSYTHASAIPGETYYYKVKATIDETGDSGTSAVVKQTARCAQPEVTGTNRLDGKPRLLWDAVEDAAKYEIYRSTSGKDGTFYKQYTTTAISYTNTSAETDQTYYYKVRALTDNNVKGAFSEVVERACKVARPELTGKNRIIDGKPSMSWDAVKGAEKYEIYRSTSGKDGTFYKQYTTTGKSYTNTSAETGKTYYYKVRGISESGIKGAFGNVAKIEALDVTPVVTAGNRESDGKPTLKWEAVKGAVEYEVYRSTSGKDGTFYKQYTTTGKSYTHTSAVEGKTYYYKVRGVSESGTKGLFSEVVKNSIK